MRVTYAQPANAAHNRAIAHLADESPVAAARLYKRFDDACRRLGRFPQLGRVGSRPDTRELVVAGTPYIFVYRVDADGVVILDILHSSRKPS